MVLATKIRKLLFIIFNIILFLIANRIQLQGQVSTIGYKQLIDVLTDTSGQLQIINFWATTCKPCLAELPQFDSLFKATDKYGAKIWLVSLDDSDRYPDGINRWVDKLAISAPVYWGNIPEYGRWIDFVDNNYWGTIPCTVIRNKSQDINVVIKNELEPRQLMFLVDSLTRKR